MKKTNAFLMAGILFFAGLLFISSCKKEVYTDADALAAMKEGLKSKNDLEKEILALQLTNQLQVINLQSQLSTRETLVGDSLARIGAKTTISVQVNDVTGSTTDMSGFDVTVNQNGTAKTLKTDVNGLVVFPGFISGTGSIVVVKTGFSRASGIINILNSGMQTIQQAILVPVFPTSAATAKISGTLTAQLNLLTPEPEIVNGGILSLNFTNINNIIYGNPNSNLNPTFGLVGIVYDGGFLQTVKTGADGKYEFKVPKTRNSIQYQLTVSTIQMEQKLMFGDYPNRLDSIRVDTFLALFGYYPGGNQPVWDPLGFNYDNGNFTKYAGVNIKIGAPEGGQTPIAAATISWAHNDSTVVTWSFTKFNLGNAGEFTNISQAPVFSFSPTNLSTVKIVTPTAGVVNITGGKLTSMYMTNGGVYKEFGRYFGANGNIAPTQAANPLFKFFEQLAADDASKWSLPAHDSTYVPAVAAYGTPVLKQGKVKVPFTMTYKGKGYTAIPNIEVKVYFHTPATPGPTTDSIYTVTQANLGVRMLAAGRIIIDTLVLPTQFKTAAYVSGFVAGTPTISTYKYNGVWQSMSSYTTASANASGTYKVDLLNGLKITDGGLGYTTAPKVRIENYALKQGATGSYVLQTIAESATTIDASGRIISVSDPVMAYNLMISSYWNGSQNIFNYQNTVSVPANVAGLTQAYARAMVDQYGTITNVLLQNEDYSIGNGNGWYSTSYPSYYYLSGKGYVATPKVIVTPVGKTSVAKRAVLQAVVNASGRISIIIVDGGKGYDIKNDDKASAQPDNLINYIYTNGSSDIPYNINLGSGYHGKPINIFN